MGISQINIYIIFFFSFWRLHPCPHMFPNKNPLLENISVLVSLRLIKTFSTRQILSFISGSFIEWPACRGRRKGVKSIKVTRLKVIIVKTFCYNFHRHFTCAVDEPRVAVLVGQQIGKKSGRQNGVTSGTIKREKVTTTYRENHLLRLPIVFVISIAL